MLVFGALACSGVVSPSLLKARAGDPTSVQSVVPMLVSSISPIDRISGTIPRWYVAEKSFSQNSTAAAFDGAAEDAVAGSELTCGTLDKPKMLAHPESTTTAAQPTTTVTMIRDTVRMK